MQLDLNAALEDTMRPFYCSYSREVIDKEASRGPGPGCSKLTTLLVNVSLKFQTLISQIHHYFLLKKKCVKLLHCKIFSHFINKKYQCIWLLSCKNLIS